MIDSMSIHHGATPITATILTGKYIANIFSGKSSFCLCHFCSSSMIFSASKFRVIFIPSTRSVLMIKRIFSFPLHNRFFASDWLQATVLLRTFTLPFRMSFMESLYTFRGIKKMLFMVPFFICASRYNAAFKACTRHTPFGYMPMFAGTTSKVVASF